jgi:hypothetical protein
MRRFPPTALLSRPGQRSACSASASPPASSHHSRWHGRERGTTDALLFALGAGKDIAINFSLASGPLLVTSATADALCGLALWSRRTRWRDDVSRVLRA